MDLGPDGKDRNRGNFKVSSLGNGRARRDMDGTQWQRPSLEKNSVRGKAEFRASCEVGNVLSEHGIQRTNMGWKINVCHQHLDGACSEGVDAIL